jgi:putative membrane protein
VALSDRLDASAASFTNYDGQTRRAVSDLAADPVAIDLSRVSDASAESGFAPYFMALAAWLGVLGAFLVVPALWPRDDRRWWLSALRSFVMAGAVAVAGAVLVVPVLELLLGVPIAQVGGLVGFAVLAALAFTAIVQALVALFGMRGWLVALLLLVLGIAASGLGMDSAAVPGVLSAIRPLLPLSYAIDAFRDAIGGTGGALLVGAIVLSVFLIASVMVTLAAAATPGRRQDDDMDGRYPLATL